MPWSRPSRATGGRSIAGGRLGVVLLLLLAPLLAGCKTALDHNLSESQTNAIVALLLAHDIPAWKSEKAANSFDVLVEKGDFASAYALQHSHGLPRADFASIDKIFGQSGLVASPTEDAAKLVYGEEQQLESAISSINGVSAAHVIIVQPPADPLAPKDAAPTASVLVNYARTSDVADLVPQIKMLVADGVRGLDYDRVSVVMIPENVTVAAAGGPKIVPVLGVWVARGSAGAVEALFGLVFASLLLLAGLGGLMLWRARHEMADRGRAIAGQSRTLLSSRPRS
ncbi:MAG TPA: type III secretion inner membrane ring lipoprotein SctJ [Acidiphilium sp.]